MVFLIITKIIENNALFCYQNIYVNLRLVDFVFLKQQMLVIL